MTLIASDLIDDAKLQAWPHVREEDISPVALLRQLTSLDREVVGMFATQAPERISVQGTDIVVVESQNVLGYDLSAVKTYDFEYQASDGNIVPLEIVPEGKEPSRQPAARVQGVTLYPIDPLSRNWDATFGTRTFFRGDGDKVRYRLVAEPVRVTAMTQGLKAPDEAESYFRTSLVLYILLCSRQGVPAERLQLAAQLISQHRRDLVHEMTKRTGISSRFGE